jgi:glycolate oxidase FAD binding subunit
VSAPERFEGRALGERLAPASPGELAEALAALAARGGAALVRGGGSRLAIGNALARDVSALETGGLARLVELDADEGVLLAEAGARLDALRGAAAAAGWELPLDPPGAASTLGGALASAAAGPCFAQPRDVVLGLEVALASGALVRCGGRVVKNVSGYDLAKLFTGSFGALGVLASAWLRLRPLPETRVLLVAAPPTDAALALEASRRPAVRAALCLDAGFEAGGAARLLLEIAGDEPAVAAERRWLESKLAAEATDPAALDGAREALGCEAGGALALRVAVLPSAVAFAASALRAAGAAVATQPARGLVHARAALAGEAAEDGAAPILAAARDAAARGRGSWRVLAAPLAVKRSIDVFGEPGPRLALLRRLKEQYDPACVLNPGRFAGKL